MSDMAGELSDKQKQKLEQYEERIRDQDSELEGQRKQLMQLSALVDEQQKEINSREDKLSEHQKVSVVETKYYTSMLFLPFYVRVCVSLLQWLTKTKDIGKIGRTVSLELTKFHTSVSIRCALITFHSWKLSLSLCFSF